MNEITPQHESPSIAVNYSRLTARQLQLQEREIGKLLRGTALSLADLIDDTTLLTKSQQIQIMANALELSHDPAFGLKLGQLLTPPTHGALGFLANSSPNLITAIRDFQNFIPARVNIFQCRTEFENDDLACYFNVDIRGNLGLYRCLSECFMLSLIALIEFVLGKTFADGRVYLRYPEPPYIADYRKSILCPISFDAEANKLVVPEELLYTPNVTSDHQEYQFALKQCQKMMAQLDDPERLTTRVKKLLLSHPPGKLNEDDTARLNFISKRTLARRLDAEGSSFQKLRDEILLSLAEDYLRDTKLSTESIASLLNYHDASSFRRAFKRWTGKTPRHFRVEA